ncbi:MAG: DUF1015 domain-containing protein [Flavobacteriales bacterium]|nr:DUF1015 domain-containing protein [Flavobacteriales bacterium]
MNFIPFRALRPRPQHAAEITGMSAEFTDDESLIEFLRRNPDNAMLLTKMHLLDASLSQNSEPYYSAIEQFAADLRINPKVIRDEKPAFYIYRQRIDGVPHTGIVGLVDVENFLNGEIKRHENTRVEREKFIGQLFERTGIITQPVLMGHQHHADLEEFALRFAESNPPILELETATGSNQIWMVHQDNQIAEIRSFLEQLESLYIMDGHHRIATVARLYNEHKDEAHRYLPAFLLDEHQLQIDPFHRIVQIQEPALDDLLEMLALDFEVTALRDIQLHAGKHGRFILISNGRVFQLDYTGSDRFELDVLLFEEIILKKHFKIMDSRHDNRLSFAKGHEATRSALRSSQATDTHLFILNPCTFDEIRQVSERGEVMPPKSTSIEPKSRTGILMCEYGRQKPLFIR